MEVRTIKNHPFYPPVKEGSVPIVVQKYGGTSMGSPDRIVHVAKRIRSLHDLGYRKIAVVVSAMSGETNRLINLVEQVNPKASALSLDFTVASGEQVSVGLLVAALEGEGLKALPFAGFQLGIRTDEAHSAARIQDLRTELLHDCWDNKTVPVIAGYQGLNQHNQITTLGRGGSDTSAVAVAAALQADLCEINTDVDGFYSADPRIVPDAKLMEEMSYELALEMAILGSKVLHHRCVELAAKYRLPLVTRNTFKSEENARTMMSEWKQEKNLEAPVVSGVALEKKIARILVSTEATTPNFLSHVFSCLSEKGLNVDVIVHDYGQGRGSQVAFTCASQDYQKCKDILSDLSPNFQVSAQNNLAKISIVGIGMISHHGVARRMFTVLSDAAINIHMVSTSEIKVTCVIDENKAEEAMKVLHKEFVA